MPEPWKRARRIAFTTSQFILASFSCVYCCQAEDPVEESDKGIAVEVRDVPLFRNGAELWVQTEINGVAGYLLLDTGAMSSSFELSQASALKVKLSRVWPWDVTRGAAGRINGVRKGQIEGVIMGCRKEDFPTLSAEHEFFDDNEGREINGKPDLGGLGLSELIAAGAVVDCGNDRMALHPDTPYIGPAGWQQFPMQEFRFFRTRFLQPLGGFLWMVPVQIADKPCMMVVDTGCNMTILLKEFAHELGVVFQSSGIADILGGSSRMFVSDAAPDLVMGGALPVGAIRVIGLDIDFMNGRRGNFNGEELPLAGLLGFPQLKRMGAIIDCKRGILYVSTNSLAATQDAVIARRLGAGENLLTLNASFDAEAYEDATGKQAAIAGWSFSFTPGSTPYNFAGTYLDRSGSGAHGGSYLSIGGGPLTGETAAANRAAVTGGETYLLSFLADYRATGFVAGVRWYDSTGVLLREDGFAPPVDDVSESFEIFTLRTNAPTDGATAAAFMKLSSGAISLDGFSLTRSPTNNLLPSASIR